MAIANFAAATNTSLDAVQGDFLAKNAALDDSDAEKENLQILTVAYVLVKALRARKRSSNARDRLFARFVGGHSERAFMRLLTMIEPVYQEFLTAANAVDDPATDPVWTANFCDQGTGPKSGPAH